MKHLTAPEFWEHLDELPQHIQTLARKKYDLLKENPKHPSLHFKPIEPSWSVRVNLQYRALGIGVPEGVLWF